MSRKVARREDAASGSSKVWKTHQSTGFWSGFATGLAATTLVHGAEFKPQRYPGDGIRSSFKEVGSALNSAMRRADRKAS